MKIFLLDAPDAIVVYIMLGFMALVATIFILYSFYRWVFSIKRQLWNQKTMIRLLIEIARKQGVDQDYLNNIGTMNEYVDTGRLK